MESIEQVLIALRRVIRATDLYSKHLAKTSGLTAPQILLLQAIRDRGQVTIGELAEEISLSQATVTTIIDRLEKRGLVYRQRSTEDKRKVHAFLTDKAEQVLQDAPMPLQEHFARQFDELHNWEQNMILSSLQRIAEMMDAQHIDASPILDIGTLDRSSTPAEKGAAAGSENPLLSGEEVNRSVRIRHAESE
ncbi:MarR family winged helix-turn-helix transcriptional regulator [Porticoccus litoralis]|uniref:MarR family transcriptional regulator n=1 Tax=Porticoccus litoralis TaxID=434086 RepID=A0AAW8AWW7_9GAMM|nr:MarR family transcriptional regulator [Porticoccus litoralis]MDP1519527.1 MarR family transcriptional regulator [Porticoccus litoralis]TNE90403.1 MAG: MarR family transcriptional regulator [Gammaproteobacteria bacterium]